MTIAVAPQTSTTGRAKKTPSWAAVLLILFVGLLIAGAGFAGITVGKVLGADESRDTQVIRSVTREEQVILLSAGISDVQEERGDGLSVLGLFDLPGSERHLLMRYEFDAKFGIEGRDVKIEAIGDNSYRISVPQFSFLGYDNPEITVAKNDNGLLSWTTPEIDREKVVESILSGEAVATHIDGFRPILEQQAPAFYTGIIHSVDPEIVLEFDFDGTSKSAKE